MTLHPFINIYFLLKSIIIPVSNETILTTTKITDSTIYARSSNPVEKYFDLTKKAKLKNIAIIVGIYLAILLALKYLLNKRMLIINIRLIIPMIIKSLGLFIMIPPSRKDMIFACDLIITNGFLLTHQLIIEKKIYTCDFGIK